MNHKIKTLTLFLIGFLCLIFQPVSASPAQTVQKAYDAWCSAIALAKGDANVIVKFYAPNAVLHPTLSPELLINRNQGLNAYFKKLTSLQNIKCTPKTVITDVYDNRVAINTGSYEFSFTKNDKTETIPARFTFVYIHQNGKWYIINHHSSRMP